LNVRRVSDVRQIEINRAEPLLPDPVPFGFEIGIGKFTPSLYKQNGTYITVGQEE
jgi:hypothetical protein